MTHRTHGMSRSPTYNSWLSMRARCENPKYKNFSYYGGRGISVCSRWSRFENFLADMGIRPKGLTLERKDNSRGYHPANCVWATRAEQSRNRRNSVLITFRGKTQNVTDWSREVGIDRTTIQSRIDLGWSIRRALREPAVIGKNQTWSGA